MSTLDRKQAYIYRMLAGRIRSAAAGRNSSGPVPYGYMRPAYDKMARAPAPTAEPHPVEAEVVQLIFRLYLNRKSMGKAQAILNDKGLRTRSGKAWSRAGLSWILQNDFYLGYVRFGHVRARGQHRPIIAPVVFYKVRKLIRKNDKRGRRRQAGTAGAAETQG